ncbi:Nuclear receptor subfamily 1 group D member 2 [Takifugu flavidus]|uniref:Nuclear receptor subfamily 1 group D member 2 n=1 Tax=Takifugu flavidus TaxID=433684 RepID=A0A5C6NE92_9TELE|nr:Nuclear receptor subfamily 1 group D member 2 [Takifugu flavidus]
MESSKAGGVIAYISSSSSGSSPESCHSDSSNGSYQSSSSPRGSSPSRHQQGQPADPALPVRCQNLPGTQKGGRASSTAKSGITKINGLVLLCKVCGDVASGFHYGVHACEGSVRFGRIPKREKQRMLLEMQSAMNNMMNNSQLQAPPVDASLSAGVAEPAAQVVGSAPSRSPSSASESSSDPEPAVAMDTSPSSSSHSASDSSEEEVIGSVTRAHQETFMYNQEQSSLANEALPPTGPAHINKEEEQQNAWNHHNNLVTMAAQEPPNSQGCLPEEDNSMKHCPFRMARAVDASHTPTYAHGALRAPPATCPTSRGSQWRGGNRMYLVLVVRFASLFDVKNRTVTFLGGKKYSLEALRAMGAGDLLNSMFDFSEKLMNLGLSEEEMSLFTAVVLVSADRSGIENVNSVEALQETLIRALRSLITKNHPNESAIFTKLLLKLPDLRSLNNMHSEQLLAFKVHS